MKLPFFAFLISTALAQQASTGSIAGQIRFNDGSPAVDVRVAVVDFSAAADSSEVSVIGSTRSDSAGNYQIDVIPPGSHYVMAGILEDPVYFPGTDNRSEATLVTVLRGGALRNLDFQIRAQRAPSRGFTGLNAIRLQEDFDQSREINVEGKVVNFNVRNPQSIIELESMESGKAVRWALLWDTVARLREYGVTSATLKRGDVLVATGFPHKDFPQKEQSTHQLWLNHLRRPADGWRW
jgi:hypothetical protein